MAQVVEPFVGHAAGHRAVADHRNDSTPIPGNLERGGEAVGVAQRRTGVAVLDPIMFGFRTTRISAHPACLTKFFETLFATGEKFVHVGLVAGVPQDHIPGRVEGAVQGDRQFDGPEVRSEVASGPRDRVDDEASDLLGQRLQFAARESAKIGRLLDRRQQGEVRINHRPNVAVAHRSGLLVRVR